MTEPITAEIVESQALAVRTSQEVGLFGTQDPSQVIGKAKVVAQALKDVIVKQGLVSKIQGKEYPRCEAWTLLGTMLGVFPVLVWSKPVEGGWEARVEARTKDGAIIGAAEAQCLRAERNWANRDDFALRSMAQTRATAKCLRMPLGFVMSLSGFEVTPAEEMVADHPHAQAPVTPAPQPSAEPKPAVTSTRFPTDAYRTKMISDLKAALGDDNRAIVTEYFQKCSQLLPTEEVEDLPLRFVPATKEQMLALHSRITGFAAGEQAAPAFDPHEEPDKPKAKPTIQPDQPKGKCLHGQIAVVGVKTGKSKKGNPWTLYGIKIGEQWVNTFDTRIGSFAQEYTEVDSITLYYEEDDKGKKATCLVLPDGTRIESED